MINQETDACDDDPQIDCDAKWALKGVDIPETDTLGKIWEFYPGDCGNKINNTDKHFKTYVSEGRNQPLLTVWAGSGKDTGTDDTLLGTCGSYSHCCDPNDNDIIGFSKDAFTTTGFSHGHQVAYNDMTSVWNQGESTCTMCNMSPQNEHLNGTLWTKPEQAAAQCLTSGEGPFAVFTGPLFEDGGIYCLKKDVCTNDDVESEETCPKDNVFSPGSSCSCNGLLNSPDWLTNENFFEKCKDHDSSTDPDNRAVTVPTAFYKIVVKKDEQNNQVEVFPLVMDQQVPGSGDAVKKLVTGKITTGKDAWDRIEPGLKASGIEFTNMCTADNDAECWTIKEVDCANDDDKCPWLNSTCPSQIWA